MKEGVVGETLVSPAGEPWFPLIKLIKRKGIKISVLYNSNGTRNKWDQSVKEKAKNHKTRK
jgi:hypothetical protein